MREMGGQQEGSLGATEGVMAYTPHPPRPALPACHPPSSLPPPTPAGRPSSPPAPGLVARRNHAAVAEGGLPALLHALPLPLLLRVRRGVPVCPAALLVAACSGRCVVAVAAGFAVAAGPQQVSVGRRWRAALLLLAVTAAWRLTHRLLKAQQAHAPHFLHGGQGAGARAGRACRVGGRSSEHPQAPARAPAAEGAPLAGSVAAMPPRTVSTQTSGLRFRDSQRHRPGQHLAKLRARKARTQTFRRDHTNHTTTKPQTSTSTHHPGRTWNSA